jgi:hypothetical protein
MEPTDFLEMLVNLHDITQYHHPKLKTYAESPGYVCSECCGPVDNFPHSATGFAWILLPAFPPHLILKKRCEVQIFGF